MKKTTGFALMSPERHREVASMGGRAAQASRRAHVFSREECVEGGRIRKEQGFPGTVRRCDDAPPVACDSEPHIPLPPDTTPDLQRLSAEERTLDLFPGLT